ncbi:peptidase domain-containing ABC transporter [Sphingomonas sp. PR090111-T3T-6A]|uniref:peptidase domain-containing ABC transporter n=1 Tax=Sphingomonas sp. PR090111-T3T-6A TaxID=685778 RepID=UPI00036C30A3|nr:peptidase domain-containing ABC transporter [Sphingomonas sp. PR090111-T3T-6A]
MRSRIKRIKQVETAECGVTCVAMVAGYFGLHIDLSILRSAGQSARTGATLKDVVSIADSVGLSCRPVSLDLPDMDRLALPAILHWNMNHFVVLERKRLGRYLVHDPAGKSLWLSAASISPHFTGVALEMSRSINFQTGRFRGRLRIHQLWTGVRGLLGSLCHMAMMTIVLQGAQLAAPYYLQIVTDRVIPLADLDALTLIALGFGGLAIINFLAASIRTGLATSSGSQLGFGLSTNIVRHMFKLDGDWFFRRHIGEVLARFQSIAPIRQLLTEGAITAAFDGALALVTIALLFLYSPKLGAITVTGFLAAWVTRAISLRRVRSAQDASLGASAREQSHMIESLRGMTTIKIFNKEMSRHNIWQTLLSESVDTLARYNRRTAILGNQVTLIYSLEAILSIWLSARLVISGSFTLGMVFAYAAYRAQFIQRASSFLDQMMSYRMTDFHLERISDIVLSKPNSYFQQNGMSGAGPVDGSFSMNNVVYRYGDGLPAVLNNLNLEVRDGDHIAITGASGCGKSTLVKIMLGLIPLSGGTFRLGGADMASLTASQFYGAVGAVLQDDQLFSGSVVDNISMFDDNVSSDRVIEVAKIALIHNEIMSMPMGYETHTGDMGTFLSGGQKQRLFLARALYQRPKALILDEGTASLDTNNERRINEAISAMGITRIVIAHRTETVMAAKTIYLLQSGRLHDVTENYKSRGSRRFSLESRQVSSNSICYTEI